VIRRQTKVAARLTGTSNQPVAGPSRGTAAAETANAASSKDENQRDEVVVKAAVSKPARAGNQQGSTSLSKAQMNVVRTMVYITVCFTLCWLPMRTVVMIKRFSVSQIKSLLSVRLM